MGTSSAPRSVEGRGHRSLADQFRSWPDDRLVGLLRERSDLSTPAPADSSQLASRAATRSSLNRALDLLTRLELSVLDALVALSSTGHTSEAELVDILDADRAAVEGACHRLLDLALAWESAAGLRPLTGVPDALGSLSDLHPMTGRTPDRAAELIGQVSPAARAMLEHVETGSGEADAGSARHQIVPADADTPAEELLSRGLLVPGRPGLVQIPGEVQIALRGGHTTRERVDVPPGVATSERAADLVDHTAAGAAFDVVRRVELLVDHWGTAPPVALRTGAVAARDLKATADVVQLDEAATAFLVELAAAAGLVATWPDTDGNPAWTPTDAFDSWCEEPAVQRWRRLATAWLETERLPYLVGTRDDAGKARNSLDPELTSRIAPETRAMTLAVLAELPAGEVLATGTGPASVVARVSWQRPRRPPSRAPQVVAALEEAAQVGLVALGGLASYAAAILIGDDPAPLLTPLLPGEVDEVLIQADLTAVAPGPLTRERARDLHLLADVESRGQATVYRFTASSVRRAFDAGWAAHEVHAFLDAVSRTPVPQPLSYLVDDAARTFGTVRVGHAEAFLRADDETALAEVLHHPRAASLGLRRIAPTVLVSTMPLDVLLPRLRELGVSPLVESIDGTVHVARPDRLRARPHRRGTSRRTEDARLEARLSQVVTAIRSGDRVARTRAPMSQELTPIGSLAALREAVEAGRTVLIAYVDNHGVSSERIVDPMRVDGGWLTARDHRADDVRQFAVHRIRTVNPVDTAP
ncbi:helicase C-terminal domain-containing protein [Nocardioides sp.]|uniref:helicase C-terminal domain-containing protein n=1 Tax=Nocardioides sp. TaxID=35761 RepID=UPI002F423ECA